MSESVEVYAVVLGANVALIWLIAWARRGVPQSRLVIASFGARDLSSVTDDELRREASRFRLFGWVGAIAVALASLAVIVLDAPLVSSAVSVAWQSATLGDRLELVVMLALGFTALIEAPMAAWTVCASDARVMHLALESRAKHAAD